MTSSSLDSWNLFGFSEIPDFRSKTSVSGDEKGTKRFFDYMKVKNTSHLIILATSNSLEVS
jgi:hypothetical protein